MLQASMRVLKNGHASITREHRRSRVLTDLILEGGRETNGGAVQPFTVAAAINILHGANREAASRAAKTCLSSVIDSYSQHCTLGIW